MSFTLMLSYARSGGTLLNKCLASLPNIIMLSEVNPLGGGWGIEREKSYTTPKQQASKWYNIELKSDNFKDSINELSKYCDLNKKKLIVRDWSFVNFSPHELNNYNPPNEFLIIEALKDIGIKPFAFVRDSIDVWISRGMPDLNTFYNEYLKYLYQIKRNNIKIFKYEDFVKNPYKILKKICKYMQIDFKDVFNECLNYSKVNGDVQLKEGSRGGNQKFIAPLPRKRIPKEMIKQINNSELMKEANNLMGYQKCYEPKSIYVKIMSKIKPKMNGYS